MTMDYSSKLVLLMAISLCEIMIISGGSISQNPASEKGHSQQESTADNSLYKNNHNDVINNNKKTTPLVRGTGTTTSANNDNTNRNNMQTTTTTTTTTPTSSSKTAPTTTPINNNNINNNYVNENDKTTTTTNYNNNNDKTTTTTSSISTTATNTAIANNHDIDKMERVEAKPEQGVSNSSILVNIFLSAVLSLVILSTNLLEVCGIVMGVFMLAVLVLALCLFLRRAAIRRIYTMPPKMQKEPDTGTHDLAPSDRSQHEYRTLDQRVDEMSTLPLRHSNEYELLGMSSRVCATPYGESRAPSLDDLDFPPPPSLDFPPPPPSITASSEHSYLELC